MKSPWNLYIREMLYLEDEILEVMYEDDTLDTFPPETRNVSMGEEMLNLQNLLLDNGFVEWYVKEEKREGRIIEAGCYQLSEKGRRYIQQKRKAGLDSFNIKILSQKEREYIESHIDIELIDTLS